MAPKKVDTKVNKSVIEQKTESKPESKSESKVESKVESKSELKTENKKKIQEEHLEKDTMIELTNNNRPVVKNLAADAYDFYKTYDPSKNKTDPILNQYERAAVIGIRASQIAEGSPVLVDVPEGIEDPITIAEMELKAKKLCMIICREGREYWRVCDLVDHNND